MDHPILIQQLINIGFSDHTVGLFVNYLTDRTQATQFDGFTSDILTVRKGVPQGSVLGPLLFTLYINSLRQNFPIAAFYFYADGIVIYCCAFTLRKAFEHMQSAFDRVQAQLCQLKLFLNAEKTKHMVFSNSKKKVLNLQILTSQGNEIEVVSTYKYLGFMIDDHITFKTHIQIW